MHLEAHDVAPESKLGGVLDGHGPFLDVDLAGKDVEQRGLSRAGSTGHEEIHPRLDGPAQQLGPVIVDTTGGNEAGQVLHRGREAATGHDRAVDRRRRDHCVESGAVGEPAAI